MAQSRTISLGGRILLVQAVFLAVLTGGFSLAFFCQGYPLLSKLIWAASVLGVLVILGVQASLLDIWVNKPLQQIREFVDGFANGEIAALKLPSGPEESGGELAALTRSLGRMAQTLGALLDRVGGSAHAVSAAAEQLHSTAIRIAGCAENCALQVATVATASEEMSATSQSIAENCQQAAANSEEANLTACEGTELVLQSLAGMDQVGESVRGAAATLDQLGNNSEQIGAILGTIEDIADQTNLLALNAAIEAARAGDQGRGFAVVADEVRALADRTTQATREIGGMIAAIQSGTRQAMTVMEKGVQEIEHGSELSLQSGKALEEVLMKVGELGGQVDQIATMAGEQSATTCEINGSIHRITEMVQQTVRGATETTDAAQELLRTAQELREFAARFRQ